MRHFYNRHNELTQLREITDRVRDSKGIMSVVVGRRRIGKTRLLKEAFSELTHDNNAYIYLFISRKTEPALVREFQSIITQTLGIKFFQPQSLRDIFEFLFDYATHAPLTLVVDEFQDIERINASLFSDLQHLWDSYKTQAMLHWVCCGSLYSVMTRLFRHEKQPLLNRDDYFFRIQPLTPSFIKQIMQDHQCYCAENLLVWWCLSGGIPQYLEWLTHAGDDVFGELLSAHSPVLDEGMHRLVADFGSEHRAYFDVLSAIAAGQTRRTQMESNLGRSVGPVLEQLDEEFNLIEKRRPITSKPTSRDVRYELVDPFLTFWFRFIHQNRSAVEIGNYGYIQNLVERDFPTFSGKQLEKLFAAILAESGAFNRIGGYWDRKGENEIDIVAINDMEKRILIAEVKRNSSRYRPGQLQIKSAPLLQKLKLPDYHVEQCCLALDNLDDLLCSMGDAQCVS